MSLAPATSSDHSDVIAVLDAMEGACPHLTAEFDGETFYMNAAAASSAHGRAIGHLFAHLADQLQPTHTWSTDSRIRFDDGRVGAPDLVVFERSALTGDEPPSISTVHLLVEVLSPSTRHHDLGWKLEAARRAQVDYWVVEPTADPDKPWADITVHHFGPESAYRAP